jgi:hypothetical protein
MKHVEKANTAKEIRVLKKVVQNMEVYDQIVDYLSVCRKVRMKLF